MRTLTNDQARRMALHAQGLTTPRPAGRVDIRHFRRVLDSIGVLQLDSVNVLERSHYLPLFSRLGAYDRSAFDRWTVSSGELFEYWGHQASLLPVDRYPTFRFRMDGMKPWGSIQRLLDEQPGYIERVMEQVIERGPIAAADLDDPGERGGPWWGYAPGKHALEWLFASGRITAYRTPSFGRRYDLLARVIPATVLDRDPPTRLEAYRVLLIEAARHLGVATAADLADYHKLHGPTARGVLDDLAAGGVLDRASVAGWSHPAYVHPAAVVPRRTAGTALLSPFDSLIWSRDRVERLFGFRYRIEIYVPKDQRRYGYYVLPFLLDGELVARIDLKSDRKARRLLVQSAFLEPGHDAASSAAALAVELEAMASWLGFGEVIVGSRGDLVDSLSHRLR